MTKEQFIEQQISLGCHLHKNDGIWWEQQSPFHCRTAIRPERIDPGESRPALSKSLAGYRHLVPEGAKANSSCSVMRLEWKHEKPFEIADLSSKRRSQVRRGQKKNEVRRLEKLEPFLDDAREIVMSTRMRTGVGLPVSYYRNHSEEWYKGLMHLFEMSDRPWWGAFVDGRLIAYYQTTVLENTMMIGAAKSHSDFLAGCPNDILLYRVIEAAFNQFGCRNVEYGDWQAKNEHLLYFKQSYGFTRHELPEYVHLNPLARPIQQIRRRLLKRKRERP